MERIEEKILTYPKLTDIYGADHSKEYFTIKAIKYFSVDNLETLFNLIDLTTLDAKDNQQKVESLCQQVNTLQIKYPNMPNVAAICVYPNFVEHVKQYVTVPNIGIASVVGGFPASQTFLSIKCQEAAMAIEHGATEADMVIPVGEMLAGNYDVVYHEVAEIKKAIGDAHLKVILETGVLTEEQIYLASLISMEAGADFIKTSTGKISPAAKPEAATIMCLAIQQFYEKHNKKIGFKPAGGISTTDDALLYFSIVSEILGRDWLNNKLFRIGASRLASNLLQEICCEKKIDFQGF